VARISSAQLLGLNQVYQNLAGMTESLIPDSGLAENERALLAKVKDLTIQRRLSSEHPVIGRFIAYLEGNGEPISTKAEWQILETLIGPHLSQTNKEALDDLAKKQLFTTEIHDGLYKPYREARRAERKAMLKSIGYKTMGKSFTTQLLGVGVSIGSFFVFPLLGAAVGGANYFGQSKIVGPKIEAKQAEEVGSFGVARLAGAEVDDERRLILSHLSKFVGLNSESLESMKDVALADIALVRSLQKTALPARTEDLKLLDKAVDAYATQVEALIEAGPRSVADLRHAIYKARAEALRPEVIRAAIHSTMLTTFQSTWPEAALHFAEIQQQAFDAALEFMGPDGLATEQQRQDLADTALEFLKCIDTIKGLAPKAINPELQAFYHEAYSDLASIQGSDEAKKLLKNKDSIKAAIDRVPGQLKAECQPISVEKTIEIARSVCTEVFKVMLPRYERVAEMPALKNIQVTRTNDGYHVEAMFKRGWMGKEGRFTVDISKDGIPDPASLKGIDVGEHAKEIGLAAAEEYERIFYTASYYDREKPTIGASRQQRTKSDDPYQLSGMLAWGSQRFNVTVTADGIPDLRTFTVS
jgi:hypothetical protein